jgi:hypothetical protein
MKQYLLLVLAALGLLALLPTESQAEVSVYVSPARSGGNYYQRHPYYHHHYYHRHYWHDHY